MTPTELAAKREEILQSIGIARTQFGERSTQFADQEKALGLIDAEIAKASNGESTRYSFASFSKG